MSFNFSLQPVLHLRKSLEHQQELRLRAANQKVAGVRHLIKQSDSRQKEMYLAHSAALGVGMKASELRFYLLGEAEAVRYGGELESELARLQLLQDQQLGLYAQARRAREMLEAVREKQFSLYRKDASRLEQRSLDDLFLMRREYLRRG